MAILINNQVQQAYSQILTSNVAQTTGTGNMMGSGRGMTGGGMMGGGGMMSGNAATSAVVVNISDTARSTLANEAVKSIIP
ncbi:hypothetical protein [Candidatus Magnetominusculus xianensis]|uniref:Uncharacterized protein n=1 Tax=Candidatus Magnetominusculus xianensis TaxID=1748249 RepID=A0ABR5SJ98_9BACT|nr:hypothetical protein [Candidatus Magnetominusculus xianensis]KWT91034.1 hypothetical protein ASN18_0981 [Candidatus Magnetominusculus xianensis]MBF0402573.1 hypothetical protein [Nitrospirota bacterium]